MYIICICICKKCTIVYALHIQRTTITTPVVLTIFIFFTNEWAKANIMFLNGEF
jgi:hypothetical protein